MFGLFLNQFTISLKFCRISKVNIQVTVSSQIEERPQIDELAEMFESFNTEDTPDENNPTTEKPVAIRTDPPAAYSDSDDEPPMDDLDARLASFRREMVASQLDIPSLVRLAHNGFYVDVWDLQCAFCGYFVSYELRCLLTVSDIIHLHCARECTVALANK